MKQRLNHQAKQDTEAQQQQQAQQEQTTGPLEFSSPEEMLRWDAVHTPVPPGANERVRRSIDHERQETPAKPWWKRWFS